MIKALLRSFGIPQNAERIKAELESEIALQRHTLAARISSVRSIGIWSGILAVFGVMSWILACLFFYKLIGEYYGPLAALGAILAVHLLVVIVAIFQIKGASARVPAMRPVTIPSLYVEPPAEVHATAAAPNAADERDTGEDDYLERFAGAGFPPVHSEGELRSWLEQALVGTVSRAAGIHPHVNGLMAATKPHIETATRGLVEGAEDTLRTGSRGSVWSILLMAAAAGAAMGRAGNRSK